MIYKALKYARTAPNSTTVVLVCDGGEKYLTTVFNDDWMATNGLFSQDAVDELKSMLPASPCAGGESPSELDGIDARAANAPLARKASAVR